MDWDQLGDILPNSTLELSASGVDSSSRPLLNRRLQEEPAAKGVRGKSLAAIMGLSSFEGGMYTVTLHEHEGLQNALSTIADLKAKNWLDISTAWFGMKLFVLNPDLGVYTHVIMNVWFPPNGMLV